MPKFRLKYQIARKRLDEILQEARKNGYSVPNLMKCSSSAKLLYKSANEGNRSYSNCRLLVIATAVLCSLFYVASYSLVGFSAFWLKWNFYNVHEEFCTIPMPDEVFKIFRPPVSCTMCHGLEKVEKLSNLSPEIFEERYAYSGKPIVITDGMTNWTAQHVFGFEFFRNVYRQRIHQWRHYNCQFFPYSTEFKDLSEVFNMSQERANLSNGTAPWYVGWSNCDDEINQILRQHYKKPYFLPETAETKKLDWIFMGSSGFGAPMHVDNVDHPSWQAQLRGRKQWNLQPPPECYYECQSIKVVVDPGEIIVLDTNRWYHSTLIVSEELSITIGAEYD